MRAARRAPREPWIGGPAIKAILGSMAAPSFLDRYLAKRSYTQPMSPVPVAADDRGILFEPADTDYGSHGPFDDGARTRVHAVEPVKLRSTLAVAALGALAAVFVLGRRSA